MDILNFVNSKDIRKHLLDIGYKCSPLEAAWLIYQCKSATVEEKHTAWNELVETMPDCAVRRRALGSDDRYRLDYPSLHQLLRDYMRLEARVIRDFREDTVSPDGKPFVFRLKYYYREEREYGDRYYHSKTLYSSYQKALEAVEVYDDVGEIAVEKFELDSDHRCQALFLTTDRKILSIDPACVLTDEEFDLSCVFDWLWFEFPTPFEKGDVVYDPSRTRLGPLCSGPFVMSDDGALGWLTGKRREMLRACGDTTDMCTGGYFQDEDGTLYSETSNSNYMDLEYCPEELLTGVKRIQIALSNFLKGRIDVGLFARAYHQIRMAEYAVGEMPRDYTDEGMILAGLREAKEESNEG